MRKVTKEDPRTCLDWKNKSHVPSPFLNISQNLHRPATLSTLLKRIAPTECPKINLFVFFS